MLAELEMMKERFAKLLLGEDMSGSGKGVCTAVTISNSITNLYGNYTFLKFLRLFRGQFVVLYFNINESFCCDFLLQPLCLGKI